MQEMWVRSLGQEDPLEKDMATHSNILAWEIPLTEDPGRLYPWGRQRVRRNLANKQTNVWADIEHKQAKETVWVKKDMEAWQEH